MTAIADKATILFRTHGTSTIGLGHVYRSITVASCLRDSFDVFPMFIVNANPHVHDVLKKNSFPYLAINEHVSLIDQLDAVINRLKKRNRVICYIDMKTNISNEIERWKNQCVTVVLLDNLTPACIMADANIYPFPSFNPSKFNWDGFEGKIYYGADWIPVGDKFVKERTSLPPMEKRNTILVTMGGADPNHLTIKVMRALRGLKNNSIRIILGHATQCKEEAFFLNKALGGQYTIVENTDRMESFMKDAGLAITAMGTTIYELAAMGVPTIILNNYREDKDDERELKKLGWIFPLGFHSEVAEESIKESVLALWKNFGKRKLMSNAALALLDGKGARRISEELIRLSK